MMSLLETVRGLPGLVPDEGVDENGSCGAAGGWPRHRAGGTGAPPDRTPDGGVVTTTSCWLRR